MPNIIKDVRNVLPDLINSFPQFVPEDAQSKIINYSGMEGLKQVTLNSLRAKNDLYIFEIETMSTFLDYGFCEQVREGFVKNNIHVKEFTNNKSYPQWTNIQEFVDKYWECKYIDPKILKMRVEVLTYNDVLALYDYKDKTLFCDEIYNKKLASMFRQLFEFMWHYGQPLKKGKGGATSL